MKKINLLLLLSFFSLALFAQEEQNPKTEETAVMEKEKITTDRPTFSNSANTIGKGFQVEYGMSYTWQDDNNPILKNDRANFAELLVRIGIHERVELRLGIENREYYVRQWSSDAVDKYNSWSPMAIGLKAELTKKESMHKVAFLTNLYINSTVRDHLDSDGNAKSYALVRRPNFVAPEFAFLFNHTFASKFHLGYNIGARWNGERTYTDESDSKYADFYYMLNASYDVMSWMNFFVEHAGYVRKGYYPDMLFQGGFLFPINEHFQVDVHGGTGLNSQSPVGFVGGGIAWKL